MSDPLLDAHRVAPLTYLISGPQPISIRDQMLRGVLAAQRLYEEGEIDPTGRPLVVVGAGAGGATAAIQAAKMGVEAHLVEKASQGFLTQQLAYSRVIDPTQYDWPLDHCAQGRFPWGSHSSLPLGFRTDRADRLSMAWNWQLAAWQRRLRRRLHVHYNASLTKPPAIQYSGGTRSHIEVEFGSPSIQIPAGALIDAKGFGYEQTAVKNPSGNVCYEGQPFWGPDSFTSLGPPHEVLISGSGDGALQDFIRVLTGLDRAIDVEQRLVLPDHIRQAIHSAEDRAHRGRSWSREDNRPLRQQHEGPYFRELQLEHRRWVLQALNIRRVKHELNRLVKDISVSLIYREAYLGCYYGLNRFITLLLAAYLQESRQRYRSRPALYPSCEIASISPSPGSSHRQCINPSGTPLAGRASGVYASGAVLVSHACFGQPHDVTFKTTFCPPQRMFNVIIVRHGLAGTLVPLQRPRHLLPYHRP
jgi:hypothetical protein